jgi:septum formation protein
MSRFKLVLASASPRRLDLLRGIGLAPTVMPSSVQEAPAPGERPAETVQRLAEVKGRQVAEQLDRRGACHVVLAADTAVVIDDRALGKPRDAEEAAQMLRWLRGRPHEVLTGVFLLRTDDGRAVCGVESSRVRFRDYDDREIDAYVRSGEPMDKAGAYAIQGGAAKLVASLEGSWSNVVGLPLERLSSWLEQIGIRQSWLTEDGGAHRGESDQPLDSTNSS